MPYYRVALNKPISSLFTYTYDTSLPPFVRVEVYFGSRKSIGIVIDEAHSRDVQTLIDKNIKIKPIVRAIDTTPLLRADQYDLAVWMSEYYFASVGECLFTIMPSARREKDIDISQEVISYFSNDISTLTSEQTAHIRTIVDSVTQGADTTNKPVYMHGVTGSGKTEVFLQAIQQVIQQGYQTLYLVPEISLVHQMYPSLCKRFGNSRIAVLHSGLTGSQRLTEWKAHFKYRGAGYSGSSQCHICANGTTGAYHYRRRTRHIV